MSDDTLSSRPELAHAHDHELLRFGILVTRLAEIRREGAMIQQRGRP
jgi:hypothetical protein